ncbi:general stress protein [Flavobacterium akiainvivens]|uniref:General stress protein n=1 Tax=Flavobacterium akiainvivens TaxID=1202724 RepID=A0A0M8M858_9FLAO|nr:bacillithiol system redox-active protein YtxJ [Flavobacterium akiainvivens]KOS05483.1 general stress protein [Flavobacterium akiainvivens]SFQ32853.1 bacillithiol system protein YtxJ [Flavobacterium akiainvivens]
MSLFGNLFGNSDSKGTTGSTFKWNDLTQLKQLDDVVAESATQPVIIFKHSTRCPVSRMALRNFENEYAIDADNAKPYFLDLIEHRDVSNEIATRFNVVHQSPQVLVIKDGKSVYDESHDAIDAGVVRGKV